MIIFQNLNPGINLDYFGKEAINMAMSLGQSFVRRPLSKRDMPRSICLSALLFLAACSNPLDKAYEEAALAELLVREDNLPAARMAITRALGHRDDQVEILELDALIKVRMGDLAAAYEAYRVILAIDPNHIPSLVGVSQLGLSTGNLRESRAAIETALAIDPRNPDVLLAKGVHSLIRKDYEEAAQIGERMNEFLPDDPRGLVLRGRSMFLLGEREAAMKLLYDSATKVGNSPLVASVLMENARSQGNVPIMLEQLAFLRNNSPLNLDLAIDEVNVLYKSGDLARARRAGIEILDDFGKNPDGIGRLTDSWREYDTAPLTQANRAQLAKSGEDDARLIVARFYLSRDDTASARQIVDGLNSASGRGMAARIAAREKSGDAAGLAQAVLDDDTSNCDALMALGEARLAAGKPEEAIRAGQVVATNCIDQTDGFHLLVSAYTAAGRTAGVERVYRDAIDTHPLDLALTRGFANWLLEQGRSPAAMSAARRFTKVAPSRVSTWKFYREICTATGNPTCAGEADSAEAKAKTDYTVDLLPGQRPSNPLTGQSWR
jgi:tetratricopeptide (TPR) repeat protein